MRGKITYSALPVEIKRIANESLGENVLRSMLDYSNTYHCVGKTSDGILVGFAMYHFVEQPKVNGDVFRTGVIDCVCVSVPYRKDGFGTAITAGVLRKMSSYGVDRIEAMVKVPSFEEGRYGEPGYPFIGSAELLKSFGFKEVGIYPKFYERASIRGDYACASCGNVPDTCKGILYAISDS